MERKAPFVRNSMNYFAVCKQKPLFLAVSAILQKG